MKRQHLWFDIGGDRCAATLDNADGKNGDTGLLIVSGGNEIRSGAHGGQAAIAQYFAARNVPVFRYDRRGIGDSAGDNRGFPGSKDDIAAAAQAFRQHTRGISRIIAFGNCDAASALALFHADQFDAILLANPWVIEPAVTTQRGADAASSSLGTAAIRARYWARIKNPRSIIDLLTGKINLYKLAVGIAKAAAKENTSPLARKIASALENTKIPVHIMLAERDNTALTFKSAWHDAAFNTVRKSPNIALSSVDSASHSFADANAKSWLLTQISAALEI